MVAVRIAVPLGTIGLGPGLRLDGILRVHRKLVPIMAVVRHELQQAAGNSVPLLDGEDRLETPFQQLDGGMGAMRGIVEESGVELLVTAERRIPGRFGWRVAARWGATREAEEEKERCGGFEKR